MSALTRRFNPLRWLRHHVFRSVLRYEKTSLLPIPMLKIPGGARPSKAGSLFGWIAKLGNALWPDGGYVRGRLAVGKVIDDHLRQVEHLADQGSFTDWTGFVHVFDPLRLPRPLALAASTDRADEWFAWSRVAGINPTLLRVIVPERDLPFFDLGLEAPCPASSMKGTAMKQLVSERRLFVVDHVLLDGLRQQPIQGGGSKFAPPTLGLFVANARGMLEPVAIHLPHGQKREPLASRAYDVYHCDGSPAWTMARTYFEIADLNVHEVVPHLTYAHFCLEAVIIATKRSFPDHHPIGALLDQHMRNVAFNNYEGRMLLINPGGFASELLVGGQEGTVELIARAYGRQGDANRFTIATWDLEADLAKRGFDETSPLGEYPYRDDGLRVYRTIREFAAAYVRAVYPTPPKDPHLDRWLAELVDPKCADIPGLRELFDSIGEDPRARLEAAMTRILWASGPFHSSVNFPQYDHVAYVPAMPGAALAPPLRRAHQASDEEVRTFLLGTALPKPSSTLLQLETVSLLTQYRFDRLGYYADDFESMLDGKTRAAVDAFRARLGEIERDIADANRKRRFEYRYLRPSLVLNAASI